MKTNKVFNNSKTFNFYNQKQHKNKNQIHNTTGNISEVNTKIESPKHNSSINHSHIYRKVTEKDCTDLRNLVKKSVDDINDILNSTEIKKPNYININNNKEILQKKHQSALSLDNNMNNSTSLKSENRNLSNSKTNFTVNINNYINIPSNSINTTSKKIKRYEDKMILTQNDKQINNYNNTINKDNKFIPERLIKSLNSITVNKKIMNTNSSQHKNSENNEIKNNFLNNKISISPSPKHANDIKLKIKKKLSNRKKLSYTQKFNKPTEFFNQKLNSSINNISSYIYQPHTPREYEIQNLKIKNNYTRSISSNSKTIIRNINSSSNIIKQNNSILSKEKSSLNYHQILDKIYSKEFPYEIINTNDILKLMFFLNEYLINCNVLKDYYQPENSDLLKEYSKFLVSKIKINSPEEIQNNHNDLDKVVNSAKIIQRRWRKKKVKKYLNEKNESQELKKMIINNYIHKNGYKVKKVIGLFNSLVEDFEKLCITNKDMNNMIYYISKIVNKSLTNFEEHLLYKDFINNIILMKY